MGIFMSKKVAKKEWKAPFSTDGSLYHYCSAWDEQNGIEWKDSSYIFDAVLEFDGYCRGRSAAYFIFKNKHTGARYPMFLTDIEDMLKFKIIAMGQTGGRWGVVKRGANYGIQSRDPR